MSANTLGYDSLRKSLPARMWSRRRLPLFRIVGVVAVIGFVGILVALLLPVRIVETGVDAVTGSTRTQTVWIGGSTSPGVYTPSKFDVCLRQAGVPWKPTWKCVSYTRFNVFGDVIGRGSNPPPPIHPSFPGAEAFLQNATDQELREFAKVMQFGTDAQQRAAVQAAETKIVGASLRAWW